MPKYTFEADDLDAWLRRGDTYADIATRYGCSPPTVFYAARRLGVVRPSRTTSGRAAEERRAVAEIVARRYTAGETPRAIAASLRKSEMYVRRCIEDSGLPMRSVAQAAHLRLEGESAEYRRELGRKRSAALRGRPGVVSTYLGGAAAKARTKSKVGMFEAETRVALAERGLSFESQTACGRYNLDLAAFPFDIEVHRADQNPRNMERLRRRDAELIANGWIVIYLWIPPNRQPESVAFDTIAKLITAREHNEVAHVIRYDGSVR